MIARPVPTRRMPKAQRRRRRYAEGLEQAVARASRPRPVAGEGLATVKRLLTDGAGPLYYGPSGELRRAAQAALDALR